MGGDNPLDASAVHPEAYPVVQQILADLRKPLAELTGDARALKELDAARYTSEQFGLPTVRDILKELEKPGRDPRPQFKTAAFQEGVEDLKDLTPGMLLEGVVTNVTNFGAFVDIGVHQDGLVHISMMSHKFIKDPRELVKAGDVLKVKVLEVDLQRKRIALTMKLDAPPAHSAAEPPRQEGPGLPARDHRSAQSRDARGGPSRDSRGAAPRDNSRGGPPRDNRGAPRDNRGGQQRDGRDASQRDRNGSRGSGPPRESQSNGAMAEAWAQALKRR
jgi:uncharacterized protein